MNLVNIKHFIANKTAFYTDSSTKERRQKLISEFPKEIRSNFGKALTKAFIEHKTEGSWIEHLKPTIVALKSLNTDDCFKEAIDSLTAMFADREIVLEAVKQNGMSLEFASEALKEDREIVLEAVKQNGMSLKYASDELKTSKDFALQLINMNIISLAHNWFPLFIEPFVNDIDVFKALFLKSKLFLIYAGDAVIENRDFILDAVKQDGLLLNKASSSLKNDFDLVIEAVKQNGMSLEYASEALKANREIVLEAVRQNGLSLRFASDELQGDYAVVLEAVKQNGLSLRFAQSWLKCDKEIVLEAVKQNGLSLEHAPTKFEDTVSFEFLEDPSEPKSDNQIYRGIVLEAVKQNGDSLKYASEDLKSSPEFMLEAVRMNGRSLQFASEALKVDREIALIAVKQNPSAYLYVQSPANKDEEIIFHAARMPDLEEHDDLEKYHKIECFVDLIGLEAKIGADVDGVLSTALLEKKCPAPIVEYIVKFKNRSVRAFLTRMIGQAYYDHSLEINNLPDRVEINNKRSIEIINQFFSQLSNRNYVPYLALVFLTNLFSVSGLKSSPAQAKEILDHTVLKFRQNFNDYKKTQSLFSFMNTLNELDASPEDKLQLFERVFATQTNIDELIKKLNIFKIYIALFNEAPTEDNSEALKDKILLPLISSGILANEEKENFLTTLDSSRQPSLLLGYICQHADNFVMRQYLREFISTLLDGTFSENRHEKNSHKDFLSKEQLDLWNAGANETLRIGAGAPFGIKGFLSEKLCTDKHGGDKLNNLVAYLKDEAHEEFNPLEQALYQLLQETRPSEKSNLFRVVQEQAGSEEYTGIEFLNDIEALKIGLEQEASSSGKEMELADSEDWQDLMFSGTEVTGSCQRLDGHPDLNKCLLGYVLDGKCRIITMKHKNDQRISSRAILKLLIDRTDKPALFLERIYPTNNDEIRNFAIKRAEALGVNLYEKGNGEDLHSIKVNAAFEYEDAGAGGETRGSYSISAQRIYTASPSSA